MIVEGVWTRRAKGDVGSHDSDGYGIHLAIPKRHGTVSTAKFTLPNEVDEGRGVAQGRAPIDLTWEIHKEGISPNLIRPLFY